MAAGATIVWVCIQIDLTAVHGIIIAIAKPGNAGTQGAAARQAAWSRIVKGTRKSASSAIVGIDKQIDLTTVEVVVVAVGKPGIAGGNRTTPRIAPGNPIRYHTDIAASSTIGGIGEDVDFTTIRCIVVTIGKTGEAIPHCT